MSQDALALVVAFPTRKKLLVVGDEGHIEREGGGERPKVTEKKHDEAEREETPFGRK